MKKRFVVGVLSFVLVALFLIGGVFAEERFAQSTSSIQTSSPNYQQFYSSSDISTFWPGLTGIENGQCEAASDFLVAIPPAGCEPAVVRSDLLAEQNVPVFCQLASVKVNPLIDVSEIKSITFKGDYPDEVAGVSFHPARAAISSYNSLVGDPIVSNVG